ncbi:tetratricopeptide repeat protein [Thauera sp. ZXT1-4]|uniref:tetratricopeptide repeat protein n=1 Tax=Thauera sp. ZXT1-4 TaxID=3460294 RepID=UPI004040BD0C
MKIQLSRLARSVCLALALSTSGSALAANGDPIGGPLPAQELTPRTLYHFLLAEIAGSRGQIGLSAQLYLDLARSTRDPRIARRATEIAMYARNLQMARTAAGIWAEVAPESEEARRVLASMEGREHGDSVNLDAVQIQLARVLAQSSERLPQNLLGLNRALARVPDRQAVRSIVQRLTEPYLDAPEAHIARAQAALGAQDAMGALAGVERALELRTGWPPAVLMKAQILQQAGAQDEALAHLQKAVTDAPDDRELRLAWARSLVSAQRYVEARDEFRSLLTGTPGDAELLYAVALLAVQLGDPADAEIHFARALAADYPRPDLVRLHMGQISADRGDGEAARKWFDEISDLDLRPEATIRSALSLAREGRIDEARARLQGEDDEPEILRRYVLTEVQILRDADRSGEALLVINEALRETPDDTGLLYEAAMLSERLDRLDLMESRLRRVIELDPEHAHAYNALGYSLADRSLRLEEAETLIVRALELLPDDPFILDSLGWVRFRRGDTPGALSHLERAYGIRQDAEIAAHLGEVLWSADRREDARRIFAEALIAHPENRVLRETMDRLGAQ